MARTSAADSATSQFFVNLANNSAALDPGAAMAGYAVFGHVVSGTDTVAAMAAAPCAAVPGFLGMRSEPERADRLSRPDAIGRNTLATLQGWRLPASGLIHFRLPALAAVQKPRSAQ